VHRELGHSCKQMNPDSVNTHLSISHIVKFYEIYVK
jgi:hypothetical protein